ncbi:MAG TPA: autotransporter domain-containing protein, partial [Stellaceae bacterium]|nr:autotransporter domain-containing protein [Stellaceae bacterium]
TLYDTTVKSPSSAPGAPTPSTNPAFPSSHEAYSETDSLLLGMMVPQLYQSMLLRASEMGESRIVIGVHYPIDIIGSRSFIAFDLANLLGNPSYINNAAVTGTAINLPSSFVSAELELKGQLTQAAAAANCGTSLASCATSSTNVNPYAPSANNTAVYDARMTYGLPTLSYAQAPREQAPAGGPDASTLLATLYGGSSPAALALTGGIGAYGNLSTAVINQIILNTESPALAAFYGTPLSYWSRLDLYDAAGYFQNITGTISLAGSDVLKTDAIVGANGTLAGIGTIYGNLTNTAGGVVAPSGTTAFGAIGGMSISGNYVQGANSTLQIQPSSVGAAGLAINGMATIAGTLQVTPATGFTASLGQSYPVLTAGQGVSGLFTSVSEPTLANGGFYQPIYTSTGVTLLDAQPLGSFGATPNERSVGAVLDALRTTPDPTLQNALSSIYGQEFNTPGAAQAALAQISPQNVFSESFFEQRFAGILANQFAGRTAALRAGATGFSISSSSFNIAGLDGRHDVVGELAQAQPGAASDGYGWFAPGSALGGFLSGQVLFGDRTFVTGGPNNNFTTGGVTAGLDYRIAPYAALGLAGSYFTGTVDAPNGSVDGSGGAISLYGTTTGGGTYIDGFFSGGFNDFTSHRTIGVGGVTSTGAASPDGHFVAFGGDIGHPYDAMLGSSLVHWGPVGEIRYNHAIVNGYTESGLGSLSATVQQRSVNSFQTGLGFEANTEWQSALGLITPRVRATWQHEFMDTTETALATLAVAPSLPFTVTSNPLGRDFAAVSAGLATQVAANVTLSIDYIGEFGQTSQTVHEVAFLARIAF